MSKEFLEENKNNAGIILDFEEEILDENYKGGVKRIIRDGSQPEIKFFLTVEPNEYSDWLKLDYKRDGYLKSLNAVVFKNKCRLTEWKNIGYWYGPNLDMPYHEVIEGIYNYNKHIHWEYKVENGIIQAKLRGIDIEQVLM